MTLSHHAPRPRVVKKGQVVAWIDPDIFAVERAGWRLPADQELDALFETAEYARYANRIAWTAMAWVHDRAEWVPAELAEIERWFKAWGPG